MACHEVKQHVQFAVSAQVRLFLFMFSLTSQSTILVMFGRNSGDFSDSKLRVSGASAKVNCQQWRAMKSDYTKPINQ